MGEARQSATALRGRHRSRFALGSTANPYRRLALAPPRCNGGCLHPARATGAAVSGAAAVLPPPSPGRRFGKGSLRQGTPAKMSRATALLLSQNGYGGKFVCGGWAAAFFFSVKCAPPFRQSRGRGREIGGKWRGTSVVCVCLFSCHDNHRSGRSMRVLTTQLLVAAFHVCSWPSLGRITCHPISVSRKLS